MTRIVTAPREWEEQTALVDWLRIHPFLKNFFCKIDNEGKRTPAQGFHAKRMGLLPGVSDLFVFWPTKSYHGLWIELKRNKKYTPSERSKPSWKDQERFIEVVKKVGFQAHFCYGCKDAIQRIEEYIRT
jgi:hypothetical protein